MNKVASVSWISVLVVVAIVVIALMAYNRCKPAANRGIQSVLLVAV